MSPYQDIVGKNVLTVLVSKPRSEETNRKRMFFCPYTKSHTLQYQGLVKAIYPGYDPEETPQFIVHPQRAEENINYSFREVVANGDIVDFWLQNQYFVNTPVKTYFCFNCQAPQLYFSDDKVILFQSKADIVNGDSFVCANPICRESFRFLGIVKIKAVEQVL